MTSSRQWVRSSYSEHGFSGAGFDRHRCHSPLSHTLPGRDATCHVVTGDEALVGHGCPMLDFQPPKLRSIETS